MMSRWDGLSCENNIGKCYFWEVSTTQLSQIKKIVAPIKSKNKFSKLQDYVIIENMNFVKVNQFFFIIIIGLKSFLLFSAEFFTENSDIPVLMHHRTDDLVNSYPTRSTRL